MAEEERPYLITLISVSSSRDSIQTNLCTFMFVQIQVLPSHLGFRGFAGMVRMLRSEHTGAKRAVVRGVSNLAGWSSVHIQPSTN